jgi:hypothetical protein
LRRPRVRTHRRAAKHCFAVTVPTHQPPVLRARHDSAAVGRGNEAERQAALRAGVALIHTHDLASDVIPHAYASVKRRRYQEQGIGAERRGANWLAIIVHQRFETLPTHCVPQAAEAVVARREKQRAVAGVRD